MSLITVIIPSIKPQREIQPLIDTIRSQSYWCTDCIFSSEPDSPGAAWNTNRLLERVPSNREFIIKIDDDICNVPWHFDLTLTAPFFFDSHIVAVAPRLKLHNGNYQMTCTHELNVNDGPLVDSPRKVVPFCCVAMRNDGTRFDENFTGTWCDDDDYCAQLRMKVPDARFVTLNTIAVTHLDEGKGRAAAAKNGAYFGQKWGSTIFPDGKGLL